jgi:hypothetical protein
MGTAQACYRNGKLKGGIPAVMIEPNMNKRHFQKKTRLLFTSSKPAPKPNTQPATQQQPPTDTNSNLDQLIHGIPEHYREFLDVFSKCKTDLLPEHHVYDCVINLTEGAKLPFGPIYKLTVAEQAILKVWLDDMLKKGFIRVSKLPAASPLFFAPKKDGTLRLCVDYQKINEQTIRDSYPLPIAESLINRVRGAS